VNGIFAITNGLPVYEVAPINDHQAVEYEVDRQLAAFRRLAGRAPTHIDSHQHMQTRAGVFNRFGLRA
jgi:predicted glycoside hydrolase/deacetylase ChbG (UPF0249 family)